MVTECDELADSLYASRLITPDVKPIHSMDDARAVVREWMPEETPQVIDNTAESLFRKCTFDRYAGKTQSPHLSAPAVQVLAQMQSSRREVYTLPADLPRLLAKAYEHMDIGDPEKAMTYLEMAQAALPARVVIHALGGDQFEVKLCPDWIHVEIKA